MSIPGGHGCEANPGRDPGHAGAATPEADMLVAANEIQLLLAEKRTALSLLRTGIAVFALPLSVLGLLVATSHLAARNGLLMAPLLALCGALTALGCYLVVRAMLQVQRCDTLIGRLKRHNRAIARLIA